MADDQSESFIEELYANFLSGRPVEPQWGDLFRRWRFEGRPARVEISGEELLEDTPTSLAQRAIHSEMDRAATQPTNVNRSDLPPQPRSAAQPAITPYAYQPADRRHPGEGHVDKIVPLKGPDRAIAKNMDVSLSIPVATSVREVPARLMFDNREIINSHLAGRRGGKVSLTHLITYATVEALVETPAMNVSYTDEGGKPAIVHHQDINIGIAVDVDQKDGTRALVVPNIKRAQEMSFAEFVAAYEDVISRGRAGELRVDDYSGTTASITNPGGFGTSHSIPRLMPGQGLILGVGAMAYPAPFRGTAPEMLARMGISTAVTLTSTYDHRAIQGAVSAEFLALLETKLTGRDGFYDRIFTSLRIPFQPFSWEVDVEYDETRELPKAARITELISAYRTRGHLVADTDPLSYHFRSHADLELKSYGLTIWDLDRSFPTGGFGGTTHLTLREILAKLRGAYCGSIGLEFMHIQDPDQRQWFYDRLETHQVKMSRSRRLDILRKLGEAEAFETFLQTKFIGQKRFSLEGSESLITALDAVLYNAPTQGISDVGIGMAHRGRLNVLTTIAGKSYEQVFSEFDGTVTGGSGTGDVKYHLGTEGTYSAPDGDVNVYVAANPSHLEAVNAVLEGVVRARQDARSVARSTTATEVHSRRAGKTRCRGGARGLR